MIVEMKLVLAAVRSIYSELVGLSMKRPCSLRREQLDVKYFLRLIA